MGFQTPKYKLSDLLARATSGLIQLPDFQREFKWEDERIRQLLVTVLRGHPLGVVMLLQTGNDQLRFKPRLIAGARTDSSVEPEALLLDGQQRLTSLTQALSARGVVDTRDSRGKQLSQRYYLRIATALLGEDHIDEAIVSVPADGRIRSDFGRRIVLDLSDEGRERSEGYFPLSLLYDPLRAAIWLGDSGIMPQFIASILTPAASYEIPAIELDRTTSKAAVASVFEKVNTGGLALNVFELLTAVFAGDKDYYDQHGTDFRLNDDWQETKQKFSAYPVLSAAESTDFLQAVTLLATRKRKLASTASRPSAVSAKREDILKLTLDDYLEWVGPLREAFVWAADFLADRHIFDVKFLPYPKQLVPLAAIRVVMGEKADRIGPREKLVRWFWDGILGELYGGAIETRFVRDLEEVPGWACDEPDSEVPKTFADATFVESRLHSLRTRNAAAYKGIYALLLDNGIHDWMEDRALDKVQYASLAVDIHHIFPHAWCMANGIDAEHRESIVNKTPISARTNRVIGGAAPSRYLAAIEEHAGISPDQLDCLLAPHQIPADRLRADDFDGFFRQRRELLCKLVERATGKAVQRDLDEGHDEESSDRFDPETIVETPGEDD